MAALVKLAYALIVGYVLSQIVTAPLEYVAEAVGRIAP